ncbi:MAG TPA: carbon starvation protein A [Candidatus Omnitrophota bacterium]|jgi:carbon starvation protein|nr:carbon starvation protein A [Candidatus Omnitrophota bacterium]HPN56015.1 carbon starvation protein A [Candidatus Omnitrophota bacterium]
MNSVILLLISTIFFLLGYRFYAPKIASIWQIDVNRPTPAVSHFDGVDFVPAKDWFVLFGHHFSSIAGAGPIIGPVMAVMLWGWLPALLWIVLGSIFIGGIHDFGALMLSIREDGTSIGDIASSVISKRAKLIFSIFVWLALLLVIAVFAYLAGKTFMEQPKIVIPSLGLIPVAVIVGLGLYKLKWPSGIVTVCGLSVLTWLLFLGERCPVTLGAHGLPQWILLLLVYCFIASVLPVHILLQPRDYLSSYLLFGGLLLAVAGILISHPVMSSPAFISTTSPVGLLWPMMFITVACGANSGFHSLIASGTTSKQLPNERHARRIGFGGMLMEGFLAVIVVILVTSGFSPSEFQNHVTAKIDPVNLFGLAFGNMTAPLTGEWGTFFALTVLNAFILTTLDSAARITRYITAELFGIKNRYLATLIVVIPAGILALSKDSAQNPLWQKIWPAFGASNQLVAALALLVISSWLLSKNRPTAYSLIPALFMLTTSITALIFQIIHYLAVRDYVLTLISLTLIVAAVFLSSEVFFVFRKTHHSKSFFNFKRGVR